ncbi:MAG: ATP-dependent DNA helicase RecG [Longimicrobiales bacterium]
MIPADPLAQLDKPVQFLKGVGPRRAEALGRMGIHRARDLLYHVPRRYEDASTVTPLGSVNVGMDVTVVGVVKSKGVVPTRSRLKIFQAVIQDDSGLITCAWPGQPWIDRKLAMGDKILVTGPVKFFHGRQIQPREFTLLSRADSDDSTELADGKIFVAYPASEELPQWFFRKVFETNLDWLLQQCRQEEYLRPDQRSALGVDELSSALAQLHRPASLSVVEGARRRLAFDELFFLQLVQAMARYRQTLEQPGIQFNRTNVLIKALLGTLPFELTRAQARVLKEIYGDMTSERRMNRMLQGDVGAGKTLVAVFAMLLAVEGGYQAALMAPTEILAEQHARGLSELLADLGVSLEVLVGSAKPSARKEARRRVAEGEVDLIVGTHALIQDGVDFHRLGVVVVDEQHRFGVRQRMVLTEREPRPDVLIMSATPIPRSLAMTLHGDLDLSVLDELPPGRVPVKTRLIYSSKREAMYEEVRAELEKGRQAYFVYPLVEESEKVDLPAAEKEFERLQSEDFADYEVALIHGRLPGPEKDRIMRAFIEGEIQLLVATTVIEVGIDVPNATVMVIESADRFGLSQLHQLRGRIGRGSGGGLCILVSDLGGDVAERLKVFTRTTDGFKVAQEDLRIRGQGDLFGAQQHGHGEVFKFADILEDQDLLMEAQLRARELVDVDPRLEREASRPVRLLLTRQFGDRLKLFEVG